MRKKENHIAPEQYEMKEKPAYQFSMNRRHFFEILGSGLAIAFTFTNSLGKSLAVADEQIAAWLHVGEDGNVTIYTGKAEVGQNIRTSLAQMVAEELPVSMEKIDMVMGDTALTPYDRGTFGSRSIPFTGPELRKAAASARELLLDMAAAHWKVDKNKITMQNGVVKNAVTNATLNIGKLTQGKKLLKPVDNNIKLKTPDEWTVAGTSVRKARGESFLIGEHKFVSDIKLPGMLYGKVLRAPAYGAELVSADVSIARKMPGVTVVQDKNFIGVAAPDSATANAALKAIKTEWKFTPQPSRTEIFDYIRKNADSKGNDEDSAGSIDANLASSAVKIEKSFSVEYIAHAPLEPRAGVAQWSGGKLTVWTGTQRPFGVRRCSVTLTCAGCVIATFARSERPLRSRRDDVTTRSVPEGARPDGPLCSGSVGSVIGFVSDTWGFDPRSGAQPRPGVVHGACVPGERLDTPSICTVVQPSPTTSPASPSTAPE